MAGRCLCPLADGDFRSGLRAGAATLSGRRASCPATTAFHGSASVITVMSPSCFWPGLTARRSRVESDLTTKTYGPFCPICTALLGTSFAFFSVFENKPHADKLRRPKSAVRIWRDGAGSDRAGAGLHSVVDEIQLAGSRRNAVVLGPRLRLSQFGPLRVLPNQRNIGLGDCEIGVDRVESLHSDKRWTAGSDQDCRHRRYADPCVHRSANGSCNNRG